MTIRAVIHDWDDTITNSFESYTQFYLDFADYHGFSAPNIETIKKHWGGTVSEIVNGIWDHLSPKEAEEMTATFIESVKLRKNIYTPKVFPGIKETVTELGSMGIKLGVISSGDSEKMKRLYREQINDSLYRHLFIYDFKELGYRKPDPRIFDGALEDLIKHGISDDDDDEVIYVGDGFHDYYSAKNRGLRFYAVTTGLNTKSDFVHEGLDARYILSDFNDVLTLFR